MINISGASSTTRADRTCYQCGKRVEGWWRSLEGKMCFECYQHELWHQALREHCEAHLAKAEENTQGKA